MIDVDLDSYRDIAEFDALLKDLIRVPKDKYDVKYADYKFNERRDTGKNPDISKMKFRRN